LGFDAAPARIALAVVVFVVVVNFAVDDNNILVEAGVEFITFN
jgi:hypothetical protein